MNKQTIQKLTESVHDAVRNATSAEGDRKSAEEWTEIHKAQIETTGRITAALIERGIYHIDDQEGS